MMDTDIPTTSFCAVSSASSGALTLIRKFLAFKIADEEYGVNILRVQKIRCYEKPTTIANAPVHISLDIEELLADTGFGQAAISAH